MTRINLIEPSELCTKHLVAEFHELPRILSLSFKCCDEHCERLNMFPNSFCLGTGHQLFFYKKIKWLQNRYNKLYVELKNRNCNINEDKFNSIMSVFKMSQYAYPKLYNDWKPVEKDIAISKERIEQKLLAMKQKKLDILF
jgi:hypothetical protein